MTGSVPDFDFFDFAELVEFLSYVFGFWLFFLSPRFRRAYIARWKARSGVGHVRTAFEVVVSTACAAVTVWLIWPAPFEHIFGESVA